MAKVFKLRLQILQVLLYQNFNVGLNSLLKQGLSEPEFYGDSVYKNNCWSRWFFLSIKENDHSLKRTGYKMNVMRQTAYFVVNPVTLTTLLLSLIPRRVGLRLNDSSGLKPFSSVGWGLISWYSVYSRVLRGSNGFLLLQRFGVGLVVEYSCFISVLNLDLYVCCFDALMS